MTKPTNLPQLIEYLETHGAVYLVRDGVREHRSYLGSKRGGSLWRTREGD